MKSRADAIASYSKKMGGNTVNLNGNYKRSKINLINTRLLTSVPKRGRMVDTQKYIRENLLPYAVSDFFGFTPKPRDLTPLSTSVKNRSLLAGDLQPHNFNTKDNRGFFCPMNVDQTQSFNLSKRCRSSKASMHSVSQSIDVNAQSQKSFEPMVKPKKRAVRFT